jgi:hypothetical protein
MNEQGVPRVIEVVYAHGADGLAGWSSEEPVDLLDTGTLNNIGS